MPFSVSANLKPTQNPLADPEPGRGQAERVRAGDRVAGRVGVEVGRAALEADGVAAQEAPGRRLVRPESHVDDPGRRVGDATGVADRQLDGRSVVGQHLAVRAVSDGLDRRPVRLRDGDGRADGVGRDQQLRRAALDREEHARVRVLEHVERPVRRDRGGDLQLVVEVAVEVPPGGTVDGARHEPAPAVVGVAVDAAGDRRAEQLSAGRPREAVRAPVGHEAVDVDRVRGGAEPGDLAGGVVGGRARRAVHGALEPVAGGVVGVGLHRRARRAAPTSAGRRRRSRSRTCAGTRRARSRPSCRRGRPRPGSGPARGPAVPFTAVDPPDQFPRPS